ncbi:hypothetical protein Skr01_25400 [Sphaerisporangium krabiense]|uniref:Tyr recombinase domain-containing protein n=1 Tax=Sphaerisporangium krabiense TaxID=763782 RepID=A0A7W8ZAT3_9ACTN|nr:hypothetical protein [Sphaerisporangium krabiense]MBB5630589.1 hypothetical protein [Sphaerisporangium krabiense]GII62455.1 hypothetical protein Skr01_25400 [Sphaerisporangium krabiense]
MTLAPVEYAVAVEHYLGTLRLAEASRRVYRIALATWAWSLVDRPPPEGRARRGAAPPIVPLALLDAPDAPHRLSVALAHRAAVADPRTIGRELSILRGAIAWWRTRGWITADPLRGLRPPPGQAAEPVALTSEQIEAIFALPVPLREKVCWRLLYETAAPIERLLALNVDDLDLGRMRVRAHPENSRSGTAPNGRSRTGTATGNRRPGTASGNGRPRTGTSAPNAPQAGWAPWADPRVGTAAQTGRQAGTAGETGPWTGTAPWTDPRVGTGAETGRQAGTAGGTGPWTGTAPRTDPRVGMAAEAGRQGGTGPWVGADAGTGPQAGVVSEMRWRAGTARLLALLLVGRAGGPVFLTERRAPSGTAPRDRCPVTGRGRLSYRRAAELFTVATRHLDPDGHGWTLRHLRAAGPARP